MVAPVLLEREVELGQLAGLIKGAVGGEGAAVLLEGEAGIGKTALLARAVELAAGAGMRTLRARGGELERDLAYGVVRQLFEGDLAAAGAAQRQRWLAGPAALAAPAVTARRSGEPIRGDDVATVLHGLYWLVANLASECPLLVAVDDAHWADGTSLRFLSYLSRRLVGLPVLLVYAARPCEEGAQALRAAAESQPVSTVLQPVALSERAAAELIGGLLGGAGSAGFSRACHAVTGGNPFLLQELLRALASDGFVPDDEHARAVAQLAPKAISYATLERLRRSGPAAERLAFAVAVLGTDAELRHAAGLAALEPDSAAETADALAAAAILRPSRPLEFVHPIVRTAVYAEIAPARRGESHRRAALFLDAEGASPEAIAPHLLAAEPAGDAWVVERLRAAAAIAIERGAPDTACRYLERALAEPPAAELRTGVLHELGSAEFRAARPTAAANLREAFALTLDHEARAAMAGELALALAAAGSGDEAVELLEHVIDRIGPTDPEGALRLEALLAGTMQMTLAAARRLPERLAHYERELTGASPGERLVLANVAAQTAFVAGSAQRTAALAELALDGGRLLTEQEPDGQPFYMAVTALLYAGRFAQADGLFALATEEARRRGSLVGFAIASAGRCLALGRSGSLAEAEAHGQAAVETLAVHGEHPGLATFIAGYLLPVMVERAGLEACRDLLARTGLDAELPPQTICNHVLHARGELQLAAAEPGQALSDFEELQRRDAVWGMNNPAAWPTRSSAALAHLALGEREEARRLAAEELGIARRWGAPGVTATALRAVAAAQNGDGGIDLLRESVGAAAGSEARCEHARALVALGVALRHAGHPREAREPLREGLDLAHRCGALRLAHRASEQLVRAGARPRRIQLSGVEALTASELRVARLAAEGLANREIAQALYVTVRTVEGHLSHTYPKLGVSSREQLAKALGPPARS